MLEVLHELVDAVAALKGIDGNAQARLHGLLDRATQAAAIEMRGEPEAADVPATSA